MIYKENCPTGAGPCDSCGADLIDEIVNKLKDWELIMTEGDEADEGKRDDVRDEALTFLWVTLWKFVFSFDDLE